MVTSVVSTLLPEVQEHFSRLVKDYSRFRQPLQIDAELIRKKRVLEVGCGARFSLMSAREKYGIDITIELLRELKRKNKDINLVRADVRNLPFKSQAFDVVVAIFLIHHLVSETTSDSKNNIYKSLREMGSVISETGQLFVLEHISENILFSLFIFYVTLIFAKLDVDLKYLDIHDKVVTYYLDERLLNRMIRRLGLTLQILSSKKWQFRNFRLGYDKLFLITHARA